jgi:hypothetical protein
VSETKSVLAGTAVIAMLGMLASACGGGSSASPSAPSGPNPVQPTPAPTPTPTPAASPTPAPTPAPSLVTRVVIKIEYTDCPATGEVNHAGPFNWTSVGCEIHLDLNAKDRYNKPTDGRHNPEWLFNDPSLVYVREDGTYAPTLRAANGGKLLIQGELDGVKSNTIQIWIY